MADTIQTLSLITLAQQYRGNTVRQINRRTVALKLLPVVAGEGKNVAFAPEADGQLAESYAEGADAANFGSDAQASATLLWGLYRSNFHVSQLSMDGASTTMTPQGNRALWARNLVNASAKLATTLNVDVYSGTGANKITGFDAAIGSAVNTYAGIDRTIGANAYFIPGVFDPGVLTAPTFSLIRADLASIYTACGENPDLAFCAPLAFNKVGGLFDATRRQVDEIQTARGVIRLSFGFQALEVDGVMFVKDKDATAAQIYYVNSNHVELQYLPSSLMSGLPQLPGAIDDGFGPSPLGMVYEMLAKLGASERAEVRTTCQLVVDRPNSCGIRKNVLTT